MQRVIKTFGWVAIFCLIGCSDDGDIAKSEQVNEAVQKKAR